MNPYKRYDLVTYCTGSSGSTTQLTVAEQKLAVFARPGGKTEEVEEKL
jgi:hypothetical protein